MTQPCTYAFQKIAEDVRFAAAFIRLLEPQRVAAPVDFCARVDRSAGAWACWPWTGTQDQSGYGPVRVRHRGVSRPAAAHRVAYYLDTGYWHWGQAGRVIRHLCHRPSCCNPKHLLVGTRADNAWDDLMRQRGVDLVAIRREVERQWFSLLVPVAGIADDPFPASRGRVFA